MNKFSNFMIFINNLSDVYVLSLVTLLFAVGVTIYFTKLATKTVQDFHVKKKSGKDEETDNESEDDEISQGLVAKMKSARLRKLEESLTDDQIEEERRVEREQLAAIFDLLKKQEAELNTAEIDERELQEQLNLYR